ncbi:hypothetical protein [Kurthia sp. Dielmo]|uniref:hypothetical protein n=1 Tax=Kurthia sp. Dielmo TaxID=1033738 RepID=UPI001123F938|nr:hypothetical protein [Kurthia sp. Dielmo]
MFEKIKKKLNLIFTKKHEEPITWVQSYQPCELLDLMRTRFGSNFTNHVSTQNPKFDANRELETMRGVLYDYAAWLAQSLVENHGIDDAKRKLTIWENKIERNPRHVMLLPILDYTARYVEYMQSSAYKNHHKH